MVKETESTNAKPKKVETKKATWILASNNTGKLKEFTKLFSEANLDTALVAQGEMRIEDAVEDGLSFVENAIIKARHASRISGLPAIADDSGLCVPLLGNAPGIHSARYSGEHGNDSMNNAKLIADLKPFRQPLNPSVHAVQQSDANDPLSTRSSLAITDSTFATSDDSEPNLPVKGFFVCVLVMVGHADDPLPIIAQGVWEGEILDTPIGDNGFGYDPLFWLPELEKSAAQLDPLIKNKISHRGKAIQQLLTQLKSNGMVA